MCGGGTNKGRSLRAMVLVNGSGSPSSISSSSFPPILDHASQSRRQAFLPGSFALRCRRCKLSTPSIRLQGCACVKPLLMSPSSDHLPFHLRFRSLPLVPAAQSACDSDHPVGRDGDHDGLLNTPPHARQHLAAQQPHDNVLKHHHASTRHPRHTRRSTPTGGILGLPPAWDVRCGRS